MLRKFTGRFRFRIYDDQHTVDNIRKSSHQNPDKNHSSNIRSPSAKSPGAKSPNKSPNKSSNKSPGKSPNKSSNKSPAAKSGYSSQLPEDQEINVQEINRCLSKMDVEEVRKRRLEYNLYYKVNILWNALNTCKLT